ncbi:hypothetical protein [Ancylobacter lacus]|uniref:hypothetical protein n=1 Tax=Ancylobacter lacus TaxID=2579970 RepID=UPI001BCD6722|nr:hypothetical protein [Ancylobacter lacus]MBS7538385.1 hypothetical protein [Ancylobacter lacus]
MSVNRALLLVLLGVAVVPAIAQQIELPGQTSGKSGAAADSAAGAPAAVAQTDRPADNNAPQRPATTRVDESALRYFASQGDTRRMEAEIARLRALYPDWTPPADLYAPISQSDPELEQMWRLFGEGKYGDVRSAIAARQASDANWKPPADLIARLDEAEARRRLVNASNAQQWGTVLRVATETPALLTCANVDVMWRVAEAFAKTSQPERAKDAYAYVLTNCTNANERLATVQKAMTLLDDAGLAQLMALEHKNGDQGEFQALRNDLLRRKMGQAASDPKVVVSPEQVASMEALARQDTGAGDPLLLGWYLYRHDQQAAALEWFKLALDRNGGAKAAEGYALTLVAQGRAIEAEPIAYQWRDSSPENRKAYLDTVVSLLTADPPILLNQTVIDNFSPVVVGSKYVPGAQALGWYAYNTGQLRTALTWFQTAVNWAPNDEPSAYGLALTLFRLNETAALNAVVARWRGRSERIMALTDAELRRRLAAEEAAKAAANPQNNPMQSYADPVAAAAARARAGLDLGPLPAAGAQAAVSYAAPAAVGGPAYPAAISGAVAAPPAGMAYAGQPAPGSHSPPPVQQAQTGAYAVPARVVAAQPAPAPVGGTGTMAYAAGAPAPQTSVVVRKGAPAETGAAPRASGGGASGTAAALSRRNYGACIARSNAGFRSGRLSPGDAVARGWCLMQMKRPMEAAQAFDLALNNGATGRVAEDAAYGKSLALMQKNLTNDAQVAATEAPQSPRRATQLSADLLAQRAVTSYRDDRYVETLIALDERARLVPEDQGLMMLRGWSYYHLRDFISADRIFKALAATGNTDAQAGIAAILDVTRKTRY